MDPFRVMRREMEDAFRAFDQKPTSADIGAGAPITAIVLFNFGDMACSLSLAPLPSILLLVGQEHGRTIPIADMRSARLRCPLSKSNRRSGCGLS